MGKKESGVMRNYRRARSLYLKKIPLLPGLIMRYMRVVYSCDIPYTCEIGEGVVFAHNGLGVVVHDKAKIGDNSKIYQNVTIGGRNNRGFPIIGKNVFIGANCCILGGIKIGDNSIIAAGTTIIEDVPSKATVVGTLGRVVKIDGKRVDE